MEKDNFKEILNSLVSEYNGYEKLVDEFYQKMIESHTPLEKELNELLSDANYTRQVLKADGTITMTDIAKELGMKSAIALEEELQMLGIIYKSVGGTWTLKGHYSGYGLTKSKTISKGRSSKRYLTWTEKGRRWLHILEERGILQTAPKPKRKDKDKPGEFKVVKVDGKREDLTLKKLIVKFNDETDCLVALAKECSKENDVQTKELLTKDIRLITDSLSYTLRRLETKCYEAIN